MYFIFFSFKENILSTTITTPQKNKTFPSIIYKIKLDFLFEKSSHEIRFNQLCENSSRTIKRELNHENLNSQFIYTSTLKNAIATTTPSKTCNDASFFVNVGASNFVDTHQDMITDKNNKIYQKIISSNKASILDFWWCQIKVRLMYTLFIM